MRKRFVATISEDMPDKAQAAVMLRDGRRLEEEVQPHMGSAQRLLNNQELEAKSLVQAATHTAWRRARPGAGSTVLELGA